MRSTQRTGSARAKPSRVARSRRPAKPVPRLLPKKRWARYLVYLGALLAYAAVMWFYVFPLIDRTFINRPAL